MPWDHSNVRSWELSKAATRMDLSAYRSGLYKRAVVLLQAGSCDSATRTSAAHSLQQAVENAHASLTADSRPAATLQQLTSDRETHRRETHNAKVRKQQLRRQRQEQRHEQNKLLWQQRHEEKIKHRHKQLEQQVKQQRQQQVEAMQQLENQKQGLYHQLQQHKQDAAAIMEAIQTESKDMVTAPLESLRSVQQKKLTAQEQLTKASQAGDHMSRRAASIEPEDGECTPSPNAVQQPQNAARQHATAPPPVMQALPPPPPAAATRPDGRHQVKGQGGYAHKPSGSSTAAKTEYSFHHYPDTPLPPPPPLQ